MEQIALALLKYESLDSKDLDTIMAGEELVKAKPAQSPSEEENEGEQAGPQESAAEVPEEERDAAGKVQT